MAYAGFVRSPYAHARIRKIDFAQRDLIVKLTGKEIGKYTSALPAYLYTQGEARIPEWKCLAGDNVAFLGEPVAAVVCESRSQLEDALESIEADYETLPVVMDAEKALEHVAPLVHEELGGNLALSIKMSGGDIEEAFRKARFIVKKRFRMHRHSPTPMEPRGIVASFDSGSGALSVWASTQIPFIMRGHLAQMLGIEEKLVRVVAPDIGGGFGAKLQLPPEYIVVCILSKLCGRPVKWVETRSESIASSPQAREQTHYAEAAFASDGELLGIRDRAVVNAGAYLDTRISGQVLTAAHALQGPYRTRAIDFEGKVVLTNKCPYGPFRGFGSENGTFVVERLLDIAARELHIDPLEIRSRNLIRLRDEPFQTALGLVYDEADYSKALEAALEVSGYHEFRKEQRKLRGHGKFVGVGLSLAIEPSSVNAYTGVPGTSNAQSDPVDFGSAMLRMDGEGKVSISLGTASIGTGHALAVAALVSRELGTSPEDVQLLEGDTSLTPYDCGVRASRFSPIVLPAVLECLDKIKEKLALAAAYIWKSDVSQIKIENGVVFLEGSTEKRMPIKELARIFYADAAVGSLPTNLKPNLEASATFRPEKRGPFNSFSHTVHIPVVEVDPATGRAKILRYTVVEDCGNVASPQAVDGQIYGGVAQVSGGVFLEEIRYDANGQLLSSTFMDYLLPSSTDAPGDVSIAHTATPSRMPGGFKGMSESPNICGYAALVNAIEDALSPLGVECHETDLSLEKMFQSIKTANGLVSI